MTKRTTANILDSAVPQSRAMKRLSAGEKKALEKSELAEHSHGKEREKLQDEARLSVEGKSQEG